MLRDAPKRDPKPIPIAVRLPYDLAGGGNPSIHPSYVLRIICVLNDTRKNRFLSLELALTVGYRVLLPRVDSPLFCVTAPCRYRGRVVTGEKRVLNHHVPYTSAPGMKGGWFACVALICCHTISRRNPPPATPARGYRRDDDSSKEDDDT